MDNQESKEILSDNKLLQKAECSIKKSVKPLIEVISKCPTSKDSEQTVEQKEIKEQSYSSQTISHYQQKNVSIIYNSIHIYI